MRRLRERTTIRPLRKHEPASIETLLALKGRTNRTHLCVFKHDMMHLTSPAQLEEEQ